MAVFRCTSDAFARLRNPYTGDQLDVKMLVTKAGVRFFAPSAYSTYIRFGTAAAAYDAWNRADGVAGVRSSEVIRCAYTGETLTLKHDDTGYYYDGGFDPRRFWTRSEFLRYASMRNGESAIAESSEERVEPVKEKPDRQVLRHEVELTDDHVAGASNAMENAHFAPPKKTSVSMSVRRRGSK